MNKRHLKYLDRYTCEFDFIPNTLSSLYISGKIDDDFMQNPLQWKKILPKYGFGYDFGLRNMRPNSLLHFPNRKFRLIVFMRYYI